MKNMKKQRYFGEILPLVAVLFAAFAVTACPEAAEDETGSGTTVNVEDSEVDSTWGIAFNHPELWFWSTSGVVETNT